MNNLFAGLPASAREELTELLARGRGIRIERIVSTGQAGPPGGWYDQTEDEWVAVLKGAARLRFEDQIDLVHLRAGDWVHIPAHRRHRVDWTSPDEPTVWLAVFYQADR